MLLLPKSLGADKLLDLDIEDQRAFLDKPVSLVVGLRDGKPVQTEKLVVEMDKRQLATAFKGAKLRTVDEQVEALKALDGGPKRVQVAPEGRHNDPTLPEDPVYRKVSYGLFDVVVGGGETHLRAHLGSKPYAAVEVPIARQADGEYKVTIELVEMRRK